MLQRKVTAKLLNWKNSESRKALFLTGARQVGKSYVVRDFAKQHFDVNVEINLYENRQAAQALEEATSAQDFIQRITLFANQPLVPHHTLIFIDEVQERPDIMTMVKFLVEDGRFDYVFSGSMLGTELKGVRSYPVGFVTEQTMHPLDFEEFCWAIGVQESTLDTIRESCENGSPVPDYIHEAMMANFRTYLVVGGMPETVQCFLNTKGDLAAVRELQQDLNRQYRHDISQYAGNRALQVQEIFDQLPTQLVEGNGRFNVSSLAAGARYDRSQKDFIWLVDAGVALKTDCVSEAKHPLRHTAQSPKFKLYQSDTGMLMARYPAATARAAYLDDKEPNLGAIYENVVAQELTAQDVPLHYFMVKKQGEADFIADTSEGKVMPFEVKSGRNFRAHSSIDALLSSSDSRIPRGVVLSRSNVRSEGKVTYLPIYATWRLSSVCNLATITDHDEPDFTLTVRPV
ncbi:AAA family ATPase [Bifidobacterium lemurum]|uniref:AAA family ATPase n=1 Tax=Bifidobacterium lemurum TaxID=1603886 RepID=A0A261FR75_9BIFI|nr:ATP-binding protein [Bifidobacterium lemurum]OZG61306.1 AAA family ATPase [Bifidobacterium lemurum]QOL34694.1 ATP-binding protein [Bifidobacterium lemurum]